MDEEDRYTRITLRLPKELHSRLTEVASAQSHSMNAEIVARLQGSFATGTVTTTNYDVLLESVVSKAVVQTLQGLASVDAEERARILKFYGLLEPLPTPE